MGRYRPPQKPGAPYITPEGEKVLRDELDFLWRKKRPEVTKAVQEAAAQGDRSENAEYIYGKKQLRQIDSRVRFLRKRLDVLKIVDTIPSDKECVYFGAWITLEGEDGKQQELRIVGPDEFDPDKNFISMDSPMAKALMRKRIGDEVTVKLPKGEADYYIDNVRYQ